MFHTLNRLVIAGLALSAAVVTSGNNHARAEDNDDAAIVQSGKPPDAIIAPIDEATLKEFVAKLKARYVGKPAGLVTKEQGAIAFTARAQDVQDSSQYCRGWVRVAAVGSKQATHGKCNDGMPTLRCEPGTRDLKKGLICYIIAGIKGTTLKFVTVTIGAKEVAPVYVNIMTYAEFKAMEDRYAADPTNDPARWTEENEKALAVTLNKIATGELTVGSPNTAAAPPDGGQKLSAADQADIDAEVRGDIEDNQIATSSSAADDSPITAPTDEGTLDEFIGKLKARYIGKPSGLVTKELSAIAYTGRAQDVQIGDQYCRPWVAASFHGKCGDNQPTLRCEPSSRNGESGIACYNLGGIKNTNLRFVTKFFMSRTTQRTYTDFMTYEAFEAMVHQYAANPATDPAKSPPPVDMTALVPPPSGTAQGGQAPNSTGNADVDGLRNDYAANQTGKPTTQGELDSSIGSLTLQLGNQVVDFSGGSSPSLGAFYEKVPTEGIVPDTARCTATVSRLLGDCRRSTNVLGCSGINIYAMNERQKHTTTCYELWGVTDTNLRFVMAYSYWDAEDVVRYAGTLTVAAYRNLRQLQANDEKMLGEGMKMFNDMLSGSDKGRCAMSINGTTGTKPPGCP